MMQFSTDKKYIHGWESTKFLKKSCISECAGSEMLIENILFAFL